MTFPSPTTGHVDTFVRDHLPPAEQWPELTFDTPTPTYPDRINCAEELLDTTIAEHGADRPCLYGDDEAWTYADLRDRVNRTADVLVGRLGLLPGQRVMLRGPNSPWLAACWLAVLKAGGVVVTVLPVLHAEELGTLLRAARVTHALCDARHLDDLTRANGELESPATVLAYGGEGAEDLTALTDQASPEFTAVRVAADDPCMIAYTSGTTGLPKGCVHFHRDVLTVADTYSTHVLKPRPDDVFTGSPPFGFTFGLGGLVIFPLRVGAASILIERPRPATLLDAVSRRGATVVFTAPTAYRAMLTQLDGHDLSGLRRCVSAGEHLPAATWQAWYEATGVRLLDGLGATEMLHIFVSTTDEDMRPGSTGLPVPGYTAQILDDDGAPVPDGQPGRLAVRGPVGCRYLDDERQLTYVRHGWNLTGDTYLRDEDGHLWYQARSDDMIISSGYNIAPSEVEEALLSSPDVEECAVVGVADPHRGEVVRAYVVLREGRTSDEERAARLKEHVRARITPYKAPRSVVFLAALPRTATGKLQRFKLREAP